MLHVDCPETTVGYTDCHTRTVKLYIADRQTVWLHVKDLDWAVRYLFAQHPLNSLNNTVDAGLNHIPPRLEPRLNSEDDLAVAGSASMSSAVAEAKSEFKAN